MAITRTDDYQWPLTKVKRFTFADLVDDEAVNAHWIPPGAIVVGGALVVETAWDSATTATLDIGDSVDPDRYTASPIDLKTAGRTALTLTGHKYASPTNLQFFLAEAGTAATEGEAYVELTIVLEDRQNEQAS